VWLENFPCTHFPEVSLEETLRGGQISQKRASSSGKTSIESSLAKVLLRGDADAMDGPVFIAGA